MERFWNYIHYHIYLFEKSVSKIITYPIELIFDLIYKLPFISKGLKKRGSSREHLKKATDNTINNLEYGQNITFAGIQMGGILVLFEYSMFNFIQAILGKMLIQHIWENSLNKCVFLIGSLIIPAIINYQLLWKGDKYLAYFKEFEKESKGVKRKWAWVSFWVVVGTILLLVFSFWVMTKG